MLKFKSYCFVICALSFVILMNGCATVKEYARGFAGVSTKVLEDQRPAAIKKTYPYGLSSCYAEVKKILVHAGSYIYAENIKKKILAIYVSETDTTPVGIFFVEIDANNTQVEVSSPSTFAKEFISGKIFSALEKSLNPAGSEPRKQ